MPQPDLFGYDLAVSDRAASLAWNRTVLGFLTHSADAADHLQQAISREPDFLLATVARGLFCLLLGRRELVETAREAHRTALSQRQRNGAGPRETLYLDSLGLWLQGRPLAAAARLEEVLTRFPADALALKLVHAIRFMMGDAKGMRASIERVLPHYGEDHPAHGYVLGCHAFALEETGDLAAAEAAGRRAVAHSPDDAWGIHAVAHVHEMRGERERGIAWLTGRPQGWAHCNNFRYHMWWHLALMHLDRGEIDEVLALYDSRVRHEHTDDYRDISNGASLLARLEIEGVDVGERWHELAELSAGRTEDDCLVFADLHYMLSLVGDRREEAVEKLLRQLKQRGARGESDMDTVTASAGVQSAEALHAYQHGNYGAAFRGLAAARPNLQSVGGSHAQRDVFEQLMIEAAMRAGLLEDARTLLDERLERRGGSDGFASRRLAMLAGALNDGSNSLAESSSVAHVL
ncbi:tetratricopeptide repeat protein [Breoghania sp.]|uniref:tetratricopeptide repeat protein n=1 Tax=Breoghania sp. TaxID=2065378 RepID=UPI002AA85980|nr:tetratricopeptide repeat protein [Breoghania sp.]